MDSAKYTRTIQLSCPTCGNTTLEQSDVAEGEAQIVSCPSCGRVMTRDELVRENSENIEAVVDEVKAEIVEDVAKQFRDMLKNTFKGSNVIRIK